MTPQEVIVPRWSVTRGGPGGPHCVMLNLGSQSFRIHVEYDPDHPQRADWYARQVGIAMENLMRPLPLPAPSEGEADGESVALLREMLGWTAADLLQIVAWAKGIETGNVGHRRAWIVGVASKRQKKIDALLASRRERGEGR